MWTLCDCEKKILKKKFLEILWREVWKGFNFRHPEFRFIIEFYILLSDISTAPLSSEELSELQKLLMKKHKKQNQDSEMSRWLSVVQ